ncbi:glucose-1-phosphate adenylyltransferase large subunit 3, chloroplastic/amyloplastic-like isoform X2 [Cyclopterus lumpus]|uniref:glucose-1-phosphate adenylyltransferase large subunit 3, chloroplastic/amyloplastic-like isoform X2 n=1 Tax=Cyclopterus lumpus TaxID=8103 RepID=UPI0014871000|nr:glucose-1-phosphate adenylyltransferase large subunit 3, chloroplastic/amyloplastic-like isoform X2 [Cyclopterus lumpus]
MKAVILAAGYGTRLQRDVAADSTGKFAHLSGTAKPLLPVGRCALISHWVRALTASDCVDRIYVVVSNGTSSTNAVYLAAFEEWASHFTNVEILSDRTTSNDGRLGAVACLQLAVKHFEVEDHVLIIGGDTLFKEDFSLSKVKERFSDLQAKSEDSCLVLSYQCDEQDTRKYGILEVDGDLRVLCMKEKPLPTETKSRRACPCFYVFSKKSLPLLDTFLEEKKEAPIDEKDAPGNFVSWLIPREPVYIHQISGRFDVGNLPSYIECDLYFREKLQDAGSYMV